VSDRYVTIELERTQWMPGQVLRGRYALDRPTAPLATGVEVLVYWNTHGKGDEERAYQFRQRATADEGPLLDEQGGGSIAVRLPTSPVSYDGVLVKIVWYVEVRITFAGGADATAVATFRLGSARAAGAADSEQTHQ
jgi:hypothetical protein